VLIRNLDDDFLFLCELAFRCRKRDARINLRYAFTAFLLQLDRVLLESRHDRQLRESFHFRLCKVDVLLTTLRFAMAQ